MNVNRTGQKNETKTENSLTEVRAPRVSPDHKLCNEVIAVSLRQIELLAEE